MLRPLPRGLLLSRWHVGPCALHPRVVLPRGFSCRDQLPAGDVSRVNQPDERSAVQPVPNRSRLPARQRCARSLLTRNVLGRRACAVRSVSAWSPSATEQRDAVRAVRARLLCSVRRTSGVQPVPKPPEQHGDGGDDQFQRCVAAIVNFMPCGADDRENDAVVGSDNPFNQFGLQEV